MLEEYEKYIDGEKWVKVYAPILDENGNIKKEPVYEEIWQKESDIRKKLHLTKETEYVGGAETLNYRAS